MASRRAGSKRKQVGSSSTGGQAQEEGNISQSNLFLDTQASAKELGWKDYVEIKEHVYYEVVHQFYANLKPRGNKCKTMVAGVSFQFSPRDICAVLDILEGGDDEFRDVNHALVRARIAPNCTENQIKVGSLTPKNRALQWIISRIIAQRKGLKSFVLASDLPWFDYLLNGKRVNLGRFIFQSLVKNYSSDMGLLHGALITRLVKRNNIDLESFKHGRIKAGTILTKASFEKMQVVFRNGSWMKKGDQVMEQQADEEEGDTDQEMAEQREEEHEDDSPRPFQASM
ncbi:hypothetical protein SLEP1_g55040 [Rubroshorea leprosula]|uniref:Putative plant transposon protein domain-containing protein n=1 Tax=Rubroshorea leprosula TaxID=152421 RepID=A0AAV5MF29_9ROSI|nr:hypothetical protein SLEP1_g55040 [Rubroshorea leprosula]